MDMPNRIGYKWKLSKHIVSKIEPIVPKLPDFEALAIFAKVVELRSFAAAASELALSKATVSKAVSRLEQRLGARLFNRTSRRLALTDAGQKLSGRAAQLLVDGEAAENEALAQSVAPRGLVRLAVPMTFGVKAVAPLLPEFFGRYPDVAIDLHLSDAMVDLIGEGFDAGLRIATLPDSSLIARRLCAMPRHTVAAPSYLKRYGRPTHPMHLAQHRCFGYAYLSNPDVWHYTNAAGEEVSVRPAGPLRVNNGEAVMPALVAGLGIADLPDFIVGDAIAAGEVEVILKGWKQREGSVHLLTPPGGPRPARVEALADFLTEKFASAKKRAR
jgi:DNA-binding transcriptional LysR family regulator